MRCNTLAAITAAHLSLGYASSVGAVMTSAFVLPSKTTTTRSPGGIRAGGTLFMAEQPEADPARLREAAARLELAAERAAAEAKAARMRAKELEEEFDLETPWSPPEAEIMSKGGDAQDEEAKRRAAATAVALWERRQAAKKAEKAERDRLKATNDEVVRGLEEAEKALSALMDARGDGEVSVLGNDAGGALVSINKDTVEFTAGLLGATASIILLGGLANPALAAAVAATTNYLSKTEGDVGDIVRGLTKRGIESYNHIAKLGAKYEVLQKSRDVIAKVLSGTRDDPEYVGKLEMALSKTTSQMEKVLKEYDLVHYGLILLRTTGNLIELSVDGAVGSAKSIANINRESKLLERVTDTVGDAVQKVQEKAEKDEALRLENLAPTKPMDSSTATTGPDVFDPKLPSAQSYLDTISEQCVADGDVEECSTALTSYLDTLNDVSIGSDRPLGEGLASKDSDAEVTGAGMVSYLDALSSGQAHPRPAGTSAITSYLDALSAGSTHA